MAIYEIKPETNFSFRVKMPSGKDDSVKFEIEPCENDKKFIRIGALLKHNDSAFRAKPDIDVIKDDIEPGKYLIYIKKIEVDDFDIFNNFFPGGY